MKRLVPFNLLKVPEGPHLCSDSFLNWTRKVGLEAHGGYGRVAWRRATVHRKTLAGRGVVNSNSRFYWAGMKGRVPRRDTSSLRDLRVVPPLCFGIECGLSGDASSADGNAAEDSVVNEAPRLPSITEGLIVW